MKVEKRKAGVKKKGEVERKNREKMAGAWRKEQKKNFENLKRRSFGFGSVKKKE